MTYATIQPPFTLKFREMSKTELADYYRWFFHSMPDRIEELTKAVKQSEGFEQWSPDFSESSLDALGSWFASQVESRPLTLNELAELPAYLVKSVGPELTNLYWHHWWYQCQTNITRTNDVAQHKTESRQIRP
jgi:hypothetical protein